MGIWFTEKQTAHFGITAEILQTHVSEQTAYQKLDMVETAEFGNMLLLDDMVMTTERDEFVYHEMVTHVPLNSHPNPEHVLVVGGGDGGAIREILKHPEVMSATLVEIDGQVVEYSKQYLPTIAGALDDPRVTVEIADGFMHIAESENRYDVIMVDSTEPVGPAVNLFTKGFYEGIKNALKEDGLFVAQTDNPWFQPELVHQAHRDISATFPITKVYTCNIPTYPSGLWTFTLGSKRYDPLQVDESRMKRAIDTKYYTADLHRACFALPKFVDDLTQTTQEEN
ncbi:polyamine aminopropyltransferase [Salisediminibacterium halotolerans]|uniref:Polyamine aminopropyltransferase n=1 Tax=Salisediminibacterium halotolerans TaxID=517425 RepID=A0A1H9QWN9_9BACI|nr:polyamine aminopropyltransferase [Salisediminibacterium haloalkalitolerans]SER64249.1 spermidine synthase [Salisediminibacterium haloalkalitolerans]